MHKPDYAQREARLAEHGMDIEKPGDYFTRNPSNPAFDVKAC